MEFEIIQRSAQQALQNTADAASKLQSQQLKPPNHLEVPKSKSPQLITSQRSPGAPQSGAGQKQGGANASASQSQGFAIGSAGSQGSGAQGQNEGVSIATVVEVGTSQFKSSGGGSFCLGNLSFCLIISTGHG